MGTKSALQKTKERVMRLGRQGFYSIEIETGKAPRLYYDDVFAEILEINKEENPEKAFSVFFELLFACGDENLQKKIYNKDRAEYIEYFLDLKISSKTKLIYFCGLQDVDDPNMIKIEGYIKFVEALDSNYSYVKANKILSSSYSSILKVNIKTGEFDILSQSTVLDKALTQIKDKLSDNADYVEKLKEAAELFVLAEDRKRFIRELTGDEALDKVAKGVSWTTVVKVIFGEQVYHVEIKVGSEPQKEPEEAVVGIRSIENEYKKEKELEELKEARLNALMEKKQNDAKNAALFKQFDDQFDSVVYVSFSESNLTDNSTLVRTSDLLKRIIPGWDIEYNFHNKLGLIYNYLVAEEDKLMFFQNSRRPVILYKLKDAEVYSFRFRARIDYKISYYELRFSADKDSNNEIVGFVAGLKCVDKEVAIQNRIQELIKQGEENESFKSLFVDAYVSAYYVDMYSDTFITFKTTDALAERYYDNLTYSESIERYIDQAVLEEDKPKMYKLCNLNYIKEKLKVANYFSVVFTDTKTEGSKQFYKMKVIKGKDEKHFGMAFANVNEQYSKEAKIKHKLEKMVKQSISALDKKNASLEKMNNGIFELLGTVVESRDEESGSHVQRVRYLTQILATEVMRSLPEYGLTEEDVHLIAFTSPLHDVGKISIPDAILRKPGKLTPEEFDIMKTHCEKGVQVIGMMSKFWDEKYTNVSKDIIMNHHEKWDGRGYPRGLKGDDIPISAQIVSIADCYDALTHKRVYKDAFDPQVAFDMILDGKCGCFSEKLLKCLVNVKKDYLNSQRSVKNKKTSYKVLSENDYVESNILEIDSDAFKVIQTFGEHLPHGFFIYQANDTEKIVYTNQLMANIFECQTKAEFLEHVNNSFKGIVYHEDLNETELSILNQIGKSEEKVDHVIYRINTKKNNIKVLDDVGFRAYSERYGDIYIVFADLVNDVTGEKTTTISDVNFNEYKNDSKAKCLTNLNFLIMDDNFLTREMTRDILENEGAYVDDVKDATECLEMLAKNGNYDFVITDLMMDGINGVEAIKLIREAEITKTVHVPIIALTSDPTSELAKQSIIYGASEVLGKPLNIMELMRIVISNFKDHNTKIKTDLLETVKISHTDPLTHVKNLVAYNLKVEELTHKIVNFKDFSFGFILCDINDLKKVNDTFGHMVGDIYIKNCCKIICDAFKNSPIYRIGGDEFVIVLEDKDLQNNKEIIDEINEIFNKLKPIRSPQNGYASMSFGLAIYDPLKDDKIQDTFTRADKELYLCKELYRKNKHDFS